MTVDIDIDGCRRQVDLERTDRGPAGPDAPPGSGQGRWAATLGGRSVTVDAVRAGGGWSLLIDGASYEVAIEDRGRGVLTIHLGGHAIAARVIDPRAFARRDRHQRQGERAGAQQITAPMPGRVVKVLVRAGDQVTARQGLVVVEAMKMENELRAAGSGIVREVRAEEGASVDAGAILVVLE